MILRSVILVALLAAYGILGGYAQAVFRTDIVYDHFAYIPIVLAGMWWGRRAVFVAAAPAALIGSLHALGTATAGVGEEIARVFFFVGVAFCVGTLSEKVMAGRQARRLSEEKYRLIVDKSLAGIFVYRDDKFLFANVRFGEMLGCDPSELAGKGIWDVMHPEDRPRVRELVRKRNEEGLSDLHYECRLTRKNGEPLWANVASSPATYEGGPAILVNVYDITDRKESERKQHELAELARKQEEQLIHSTRLAELGEMAAGVAHELNQPLTGIRNFARNAFYMMDKNVGSPEEVKENLRLISDQVDRAAKIISQMRELTRRSERQFARVDLNGIIRETVEFLSPQMKLSGVEVALDLADGLPEILGDRIRLEQVLLNLLTNARQAMELTEKRRLTVRSRLTAGSDRPVAVEVADTGKGFAREVAEKLFTPFFSTKKVGHGTGLGLSISLSIIKDHQGVIEAKGEPGKGATFTIRLPLPTEHERQGAVDQNE